MAVRGFGWGYLIPKGLPNEKQEAAITRQLTDSILKGLSGSCSGSLAPREAAKNVATTVQNQLDEYSAKRAQHRTNH